MKKYLTLLSAILALVTVFVGCNKTPDSTETESTEKAETASVEIVIDGNNFSESFNETKFYEELDAIEGLFHTKNNETNEYTLTMTESAYTELKNLKSKSVKDAYNDIINDSENYVIDIKYDEEFHNVKVYADKEKLSGELSDYDSILLKIIGPAMVYQLYVGENQRVNVTVFNFENEEIIKTVSYPVSL